jgi:DNA ligase-associated metallophosphoesterase
MKRIEHEWGNNLWILDHRKCIFDPKKGILLIADLHLGKLQHFRKAGIALPSHAANYNYVRLQSLIDDYMPGSIIFLGDLFHSRYNNAWLRFRDFLEFNRNTEFHLIKGNHDIMEPSVYSEVSMNIHLSALVLDNLIFTHEPLDDLPEKHYNICGHIHPAIRLEGKGRQRIKLPCFYFRKNQCILPAFGVFTGTHIIQPSTSDHVFAIADSSIMEFQCTM